VCQVRRPCRKRRKDEERRRGRNEPGKNNVKLLEILLGRPSASAVPDDDFQAIGVSLDLALPLSKCDDRAVQAERNSLYQLEQRIARKIGPREASRDDEIGRRSGVVVAEQKSDGLDRLCEAMKESQLWPTIVA
jgi:hypothetical protein